LRHVHSVHVAKAKWQTVIPSNGEPDEPAVRRISVPGGYLYQVEHFAQVDDIDEITRIEWFPPVYVPFHGDGQ
jgi:hypothetical protein